MKKYLLVSAIVAAAACAVYAQTAPAEQKKAPAIKVEKIVTAASVEKREPVGEAAAFDGAAQVYTWTKITAEQLPTTIKHIYYLNGKNVREITLTVHTSPYRAWSVKNVVPGDWKVDVTDEAGNVLATASFTVTAAAPKVGK